MAKTKAGHKATPSTKVVKKIYKVWMTIEEITIFDDGDETYRDMEEEETYPVGEFTTPELALDQMKILYEIHHEDGDAER